MLGGLSEKEFMEALRRVGTPVLAVPYVGSFAGVGERRSRIDTRSERSVAAPVRRESGNGSSYRPKSLTLSRTARGQTSYFICQSNAS
jgi:hypothetical protein